MPKYTPDVVKTLRALVASSMDVEFADSLSALELKAIGEKLGLVVYQPELWMLEENMTISLEIPSDDEPNWLSEIPTDDEPYVSYTVYEHGSAVSPVDRHW